MMDCKQCGLVVFFQLPNLLNTLICRMASQAGVRDLELLTSLIDELAIPPDHSDFRERLGVLIRVDIQNDEIGLHSGGHPSPLATLPETTRRRRSERS